MDTNCRFYPNELPDEDSYVMARMLKVDQNGVTCELLEYNNHPAYMPISQLSRKRVKSMRQLAKAGNEEILQVLSVNTKTGAIDLTKKTLEPEEVEKAEVKYRKSKRCHNMMRRIAQVCHTDVGNVCNSFGWNLYSSTFHPLDLMERSIVDQSVWDEFEIPNNMKIELIKIVEHRVQVAPKRYDMTISVCCYNSNGVDNLQKLFKELETTVPEVSITIQSSPLYTVTCEALNTEEMLQKFNKMNDQLSKVSNQFDIQYTKVSEPKCSSSDE